MVVRILSLCSGIDGFEQAAKLVNHRLGKDVFQLKALGNAVVPDVAAIALYKFLEVSNLLN